MNEILTHVDAAAIKAEIARLQAELDRRSEATRKASWARGKAKECRDQASEINSRPTHGRMGKETNQARAAAYLRSQAKDWDKKADRFELEAGIAPAEYKHPF